MLATSRTAIDLIIRISKTSFLRRLQHPSASQGQRLNRHRVILYSHSFNSICYDLPRLNLDLQPTQTSLTEIINHYFTRSHPNQ